MAKKKCMPCPEPDGAPESIRSFAARLDWMRDRYEVGYDEDGELIRIDLSRHVGDYRLTDSVRKFCLSRGEFFRAPTPYFFDRVDRQVIPLTYDDVDACRFLSRLHLLRTQPDFNLIARDLERVGYSSPQRQRFSFFAKKDDAIYIHASPTSMFRITGDAIDVVDIGTDGVIMLPTSNQAIKPFGDLATIMPLIDALRPEIGDATITPTPRSAMSLLTTRWAKESLISPAQAETVFLSRLLFCPFAYDVMLWPLLLITGEQGSGKSSALELWASWMYGEVKTTPAMPADMRSLIASATNRPFLIYDNIDRVNFADPKSEYSDVLCKLSTGGEIDQALLYRNNQLITFQLWNHCCFTAREYPFPSHHTDVARRLLHLEVEPMRDGDAITPKLELIQPVLDQRDAILAELIIRSQNILKALRLTKGKRYSTAPQMPDYEAWTLRCAEYEGKLDEWQHLWAAQQRMYLRGIQSNNQVVYMIQLWLGKNGRTKEPVRAETLFREISDIFFFQGQKMTYTSAAHFGIHIAKNISALHSLGIKKKVIHKVAYYSFDPPDDVLEECVELYNVRPQQSTAAASWTAPPEPTDEELEAIGVTWGDEERAQCHIQ